MLKKMLIVGVATVAALASSLVGPATAAGPVTYTPQAGDGCGPLPKSMHAPADFVVFGDRVCGSYPWEAQQMLVGGVLALHNNTAAPHRLVAWKNSRSKSWDLDTVLQARTMIERRINVPGRYYFRDPAHSRLRHITRPGGGTDVRCLGACGYLAVTR